jgi:hypothetical protein
LRVLSTVVLCFFLYCNVYAATAEVNVEEAFSVTSLTVTSDGSTIIAAFSDGFIRSFRANSGKIANEIRMPKNITSIAEASGKIFAASDKLYLAELDSGKVTEVAANSGRAVAVSTDRLGEFGAAAHGRRLPIII